jgi:hypothetical protein
MKIAPVSSLPFPIFRYAKRYITPGRLLRLLAVLFMLLEGCRTEVPFYPNPDIRFVDVPGYLDHDTTLLLHDTVRVGLVAMTGSNHELTHLHITIRRDTVATHIDTGLFTNELDYSRAIIKGIAASETWSFYVRDRDSRKSDEISISLHLDTASTWSPVDHLPSVVMGAQANTNTGSFYSLTAQQTRNLEDAFADQASINLLYYDEPVSGDENTIASPGANVDASIFTGIQGLSNWTVRNTTRFLFEADIVPEEFDNCLNDSLILANTFDFETGKRKAKNLKPGQVYAFVTDSGRKGLFKVVDVEGREEGFVEISIKMARR